MHLTPRMVPIRGPILQLPKIPTRMRNIRIRIIAARIREPAHPVRRHVAGAHYVLPDLVDAVAAVECDCFCVFGFYRIGFRVVKHTQVVLCCVGLVLDFAG